jgi:hypothetical protein
VDGFEELRFVTLVDEKSELANGQAKIRVIVALTSCREDACCDL